MKINLKDLTKEEQKEVKSVLNGNGITVKQVNLYKDGSKVVAEIKSTGDMYTLLPN